MVSKAIASLDAWLVQAEAVLQDQRERSLSPSSAQQWQESPHIATVTMSTLEVGFVDLLSKYCHGPGRWILICRVVGSTNRFWQALAYEDGSLVVEVVSNAYLDGDERHSAKDEDQLAVLGWTAPCPPASPNWRRVEATTSPPIEDVARQAIRTLREVFSVGPEDQLEIVTFASANRENTPASQSVLADVPNAEDWDLRPLTVASTDSDQGNARPAWIPTTEPWAPYFRQLWPSYLTPRSGFIAWKHCTTGVHIAETLWDLRQGLRGEWILSHGSNPETWPIAHPPAVLWMPYIAHAACLRCSWLGEGGDSSLEVASRNAKEHAILGGCDTRVAARIRVPVGERGGPSDEPLGIRWVG